MSKPSLRRPRADHAGSGRPNRESVALAREVERPAKEPEADFFVSIPQSKKKALKMYCAMNDMSMRDWLLRVMEEKGIGVEGAVPAPPPAKRGEFLDE